MPKAIVCISECGLNRTTKQVQLTYDIATDWPNPNNQNAPLELNDLTVSVNVSSSTTQINSAIKASVITSLSSQGFPSTGITVNDVILFGGAG